MRALSKTFLLFCLFIAFTSTAHAQRKVNCWPVAIPAKDGGYEPKGDTSRLFIVVYDSTAGGDRTLVASGFSARSTAQFAGDPSVQNAACKTQSYDGEVFATDKDSPACLGELFTTDKVLYAHYIIARDAAVNGRKKKQ
jgi:hypothetical protein